jgi:hypothetical protein
MHTTRSIRPLATGVAMLLLAVAACAPGIAVGVNTANDLKSAAYRTFTWDLPDQFPTGDPRLDNNPFFVRELQNAVATQLTRIGLKEGSATADLSVHFHATVRERVDFYEADRRAGYDQTGYGATPQAYQYEEGTVLVDVSERAGKRVIWRGWMQTDLSGAIDDNAVLGERVRRGMKLLFQQFPARTVATGGN